MCGSAFQWLTRRAQIALALFLLVSGCLGGDSVCLTEFCVTKTEAIRQADWIAARLLARHADGVAPPGLGDALGMSSPIVLPTGGKLTPWEKGSTANFNLTLPSGRVVGLDYTNGFPDRAAMVLHLSFSTDPLSNWCSWSNRNPAWACLRRY